MTQTVDGAKKAVATIIRKHGLTIDGKSKQHVLAGALGGRASNTGGWYRNPEGAKNAGSKGGRVSKRGHKYIGQLPNGDRKYIFRETGEEVIYKSK